MNPERFLVTGAQGCIGAWVVKTLLELKCDVTAYDLEDQATRISLLLPPHRLKQIDFVRGDINDVSLLKELIQRESITHVIHLAGLMAPDCRANPIRGAVVNVLGTLSVFEAVKAYKEQVICLAYASSAAVLGPDEKYESRPISDSAPALPSTLYGVYKKANEDCARIYWEDGGIRSVGLRPGVVYGPGRDRGLSAGPTLAIRAALLDQEYEIGFGGKANMQFVDDVAKSFVLCVLKAPKGAPAYNMNGQVLDVEEIISEIQELFPSSRGRITYRHDEMLPVATSVQDSGLQDLIGPFERTPFREGIRHTAAFFRKVYAILE